MRRREPNFTDLNSIDRRDRSNQLHDSRLFLPSFIEATSVKSAAVIARLHFPSGPLFFFAGTVTVMNESSLGVTLVNEDSRKLGETDHQSSMETT